MFEIRHKKSFKNNKSKKNLVNNHFSATKLIIYRPNKHTLDCPAITMMDEL